MRYLFVALLLSLSVNCFAQRIGIYRVDTTVNDGKSHITCQQKITKARDIAMVVDTTGKAVICIGNNMNASINIQQFRWNKWITVQQIEIRDVHDTCFTASVPMHSGENLFRLQETDSGRVVFIGNTVRVEHGSAITDGVSIKYGLNDTIVVGFATMWEIYDSYGNLLRKGTSERIPLNGLEEGGYYLNYDNRTTQFFIYCQGHKR